MKNHGISKTMVERMRKIRDQVSNEIMNMSLEEQKAYVKKQLSELKNRRPATGG